MSTIKVNSVQNAAGTGPAKLDFLPIFGAKSNATQSLANATFTKVNLATEEFDTTGAYDPATSRFTPQVAGYYQINWGVNFLAAASGNMAVIYKNGAVYRRGSQMGNNAIGSTGSSVIFMNGSTDYLELVGYQSSGAPVNVSNDENTFMNGHLISRT